MRLRGRSQVYWRGYSYGKSFFTELPHSTVDILRSSYIYDSTELSHVTLRTYEIAHVLQLIRVVGTGAMDPISPPPDGPHASSPNSFLIARCLHSGNVNRWLIFNPRRWVGLAWVGLQSNRSSVNLSSNTVWCVLQSDMYMYTCAEDVLCCGELTLMCILKEGPRIWKRRAAITQGKY